MDDFSELINLLLKRIRVFPIVLIFLGLVLLVMSIVSWFTSSAKFNLVEIFALILGIGASIKGWVDLTKKEKGLSIGTVVATLESQIGSSNDDEFADEAFLGKDTARKLREAEMEIKRDTFKRYKISIAHPKLLSKRYSSLFLIQIYSPEFRQKVSKTLEQKFNKNDIVEHIENSELMLGLELVLKLSSHDIIFSESVAKRLDKGILTTNFTGKPKDISHPGKHQVVLSICDSKTNFEYQSISFTVQVTDFVFDHISRPFLSSASSAILATSSVIMFLLTLLGQIDSTFGLTSGTVAGTLASAIYIRFFSLYQNLKPTSTP